MISTPIVRIIARALSENEIRSMFMLGVWKFGEGSGSLVMDATGHGLNGDIQGATWVTDSNSGQALDFDGTDDRVELPDDNPA